VRHGRATPGYSVAVTWLTVTGLGLALAAVGIGGVLDLAHGPSSDAVTTQSLVGAPIAANDTATDAGDGDGSASTEQGKGLGVLSDAPIVAPEQEPDGTALPGHAPAALLPKYGNYVPFVPTSIRLPSGRLAPIQPAKVHSDGALDIPSNPDRVGWWTGGAQAGEPYGSIVLAGHVDTASFGLGVLSEMLRMQPGQNLKLADGVHGLTYRVQTVQTIPKVELAAGTALFSQDVKHRLVMITCGGPFDRRTHRYRDNVVIVAMPVGA
jgi:hypothetical protein